MWGVLSNAFSMSKHISPVNWSLSKPLSAALVILKMLSCVDAGSLIDLDELYCYRLPILSILN